jgi:hypothetical protein
MFTITTISPQLRPVASVHRPARFDTAIKLAVIRPELALLDIYRDLCDPAQLGEIGDLLAVEKTLRGELLRRLSSQQEGRSAGGPALARPIAEFRAQLLKEFVPGPGRLLIGVAAMMRAGPERLQVVSAESFDSEAEAVALIGKGLGLSVAAHTANMNLPGDMRLQRLTLTVLSAQRPVIVMEIYNLASYELVPYVNRGPLRVGSPFVILRFLLMALWVQRAQNRDLQETAGLIQRASQLLEGPPEAVLPVNYIGRVEDPEVAFKREIQSAIKQRGADGRPRFYGQYMPAAVKKVDSSMRAAASSTLRERIATEQTATERIATERIATEQTATERIAINSDTKLFEPLPWEDM